MERTATFTEEDIQEWSEKHDNDNPLHLDEEVAAAAPFSQRIVPGMMLMDYLQGMLTAVGDEDETVILSGITAARFRDPVLLDETVTFEIEVVEEDRRYTGVDFECRVEERGSVVANGALNVVVK